MCLQTASLRIGHIYVCSLRNTKCRAPSTLQQTYVPPRPRPEEQQIDEILEDQNGPLDHRTDGEPRAGSSSSDCD